MVEKTLLQYLAWLIEPADCQQLRLVVERIGAKRTEVLPLLNKMEKAGQIICFNQQTRYGTEKRCRLPIDLHLELLWNIKDLTDEENQRFNFYTYYSQWFRVTEHWRDLIVAYTSNTEIVDYPFCIDSAGIIITLLREMALRPQWKGFCEVLSQDVLLSIFEQEQSKWVDELQQIDEAFFQTLFLDNKRLDAEAKSLLCDYHYFPEYVLTGRIKEFHQTVPESDETMTCTLHALCCQYQGNNQEAVVRYQAVLKDIGSPFFVHPLLDFAYVLALMNDVTPSSKKKLSVLFKKKELRSSRSLLPARLLLHLALHEDMAELLRSIQADYDDFNPHVKVLIALLLRHYHLTEQCNVNTLSEEALVKQDHLKIFQLEYSQDFPAFKAKAEALRQELGINPLLPPFKEQKEWEKSLDVLLDLTAGNADTKAMDTKTKSQSRIIYHIDQREQIIPRLQKSKNGINWSNGRNIALTTFKQQSVAEMNETDRKLAACVRTYSGGWGTGEYSELNGSAAFAVLAGYPLVFQAENPDVPVVIVKDDPQVVVTNASGGYRVSGNATPPFESATILLKENDQLFRVLTLNPMQRKIMETFYRSPYYPIQAKAQLTELLNRLSQVITVHSDLLQSDEKLKTVKGDTLITVQLQPMGEGVKVELFVKPFIEQPPYCKAGVGASGVIGVVGGKRVQAVRNLKKEEENYAVISRLMQKVSGDRTATDVLFFDDYYQCLELIDALREQTKISRTEWPEGVRFHINRSVDFSHLNLSLKGKGQWFEVEGELNVDARTKLKIGELLEKVRQSKGRFIALGDSEFLALSQQLRRQLEEMDAMFQRDKKTLKISRMNVPSLTEMEQQGVALTKDKAFISLQKRMEESGQVHFALPKTLQAELREYQEEGFRWMSRLAHWGAGACLADDMGLGKTLQTIALMLSRGKQGASLVVAPASVLLNWKSELERFAPSLTPIVMHDADGGRKKLVDEASEFDVVLTTYGLLINEAELLAGKTWNIIVLDEAHTIKNKETKMSKAAMELNGEFRLLLTGTPVQNHLSEIWNLFQFANPGLLGSFQHFNDSFIQPIEKGEDKQRQLQLKKLLQPFLLRRTKTQVLDELPEKTEITLPVELSKEERALYENLRQQALLNIEEQSGGSMQTLAEITRLRQAACHPALVNKEFDLSSSKTQAFLKLTDELMTNNHRALVFSQFTSHLALIRKELDARGIDYLYLDGSLSVNERTVLVKQFQTGDQPLFLISLKAGGTGLNLTAADYVIHLDPWWNPAVEDQASDRAHRIGQTRPVTIYRLISVQTIEEKIIKLHQTKKSLADSLLDGSDMAHKLTKEEMLELLRDADY